MVLEQANDSAALRAQRRGWLRVHDRSEVSAVVLGERGHHDDAWIRDLSLFDGGPLAVDESERI